MSIGWILLIISIILIVINLAALIITSNKFRKEEAETLADFKNGRFY